MNSIGPARGLIQSLLFGLTMQKITHSCFTTCKSSIYKISELMLLLENLFSDGEFVNDLNGFILQLFKVFNGVEYQSFGRHRLV